MPVEVSLATTHSHRAPGALDGALDLTDVERPAPLDLDGRVRKLHPARVVDQPLAELAIAQDDARARRAA